MEGQGKQAKQKHRKLSHGFPNILPAINVLLPSSLSIHPSVVIRFDPQQDEIINMNRPPYHLLLCGERVPVHFSTLTYLRILKSEG